MIAKKFKNFTDADFSWKFDGVDYTFKPGQETYLEDFKAEHFAKHLVDREMNKLGIVTNNQSERAKLTVQCFPPEEPITPAEMININEKAKKGKKKVEAEFPDLKK